MLLDDALQVRTKFFERPGAEKPGLAVLGTNAICPEDWEGTSHPVCWITDSANGNLSNLPPALRAPAFLKEMDHRQGLRELLTCSHSPGLVGVDWAFTKEAIGGARQLRVAKAQAQGADRVEKAFIRAWRELLTLSDGRTPRGLVASLRSPMDVTIREFETFVDFTDAPLGEEATVVVGMPMEPAVISENEVVLELIGGFGRREA